METSGISDQGEVGKVDWLHARVDYLRVVVSEEKFSDLVTLDFRNSINPQKFKHSIINIIKSGIISEFLLYYRDLY